MKIDREVLEPERIIPEVKGFKITASDEETALLSLAVKRAIDDRAELILIAPSKYAPYTDATRDQLEALRSKLLGVARAYIYAFNTSKRDPDPATSSPAASAETFESMLERIVLFLNSRSRDSRKLWDVLSALRGPDESDSRLVKEATTAVIRQAVGIEGQIGPGYRVDVFTDSDSAADRRRNIMSDRYHFRDHAMLAFEALDLKWDEVNEPRPLKK